MSMDRRKRGAAEEKPQYYYLYGSVEARNAAGGSEAASHASASPGGGNNTDDGSLVGECLVQTDNEQDEETTPLNAARDRPHVVLMSGNEIKSLVGSAATNGHHSPSQRGPCQHLSHALTSLKDRHPIVHILLLGTALALVLFIASVIYYPDSLWVASSRSQTQLQFEIPYPIISRRDYNDPVSKFLVKELFDQSLLYQGRDGLHHFRFPFPTGAFWTNLVLPTTDDNGLSFPITVYPYAFKWADDLLQLSYPASHRKELPTEIHDYFLPDLTFGAMEANGRRFVRKFDALSVTLKFEANTPGGWWETYLVQGSPYVTIKYKNVSPVIHAMSTFKEVFCPRDEDATNSYFDGGSTRRQRRRRLDLSFGVCSDESSPNGTSTLLRGVQFMIQTNEDSYWLVFASEPIALSFDRQSRTRIQSLKRFSGVLRFAAIPPPTGTTTIGSNTTASNYLKIASSKGLQRLIYHAGVYPISGSVSWSFRPAAAMDASKVLLKSVTGMTGLSALSPGPSTSSTSSNTATTTKSPRLGTIRFDFATQSFVSSTTSLLMLALPHHAAMLPVDTQLDQSKFNLVYRSIKGPMTAVLGSSWSYDEVLPSLGFDGDSGSSNNNIQQDETTIRAAIVDSLQKDLTVSLPSLSENVYGFGKQVARLAQLALIAYNLQQQKDESSSQSFPGGSNSSTSKEDPVTEILSRALNLLWSSLERFLTNSVSDALVYDANLGGLVTTDGLYDAGADFGNGRYNDHHFHYGYLLYACAVMGKLNATFVEQFGNYTDGIYYDIAHSNNFDSEESVDGVFFPGARHKSWFDGHSFASGLFPFANGKSQESSSEAVNGYYGAYLWSLVRHEGGSNPAADTSTQTDFARLLLATEIRGAQTYWHMWPTNETNSGRIEPSAAVPKSYSQEFSMNYMVGNLGMSDAVCSTWFGTDPMYVHLINFLPVTAVTGELFRRSFVAKELAHAFRPLDEIEMAWRGYAIADAAIVDPVKAWRDAQGLVSPQLDSGLSKSQLLYWIATRDGFNPSLIIETNTTLPLPSSGGNRKGNSTEKAAACQQNQGCVGTGLIGDCCPTTDGRFLDCCGPR